MPPSDEILRQFYDRRADEEPPRDPEARLRFHKALSAADLKSHERVLDIGAKRGDLAQSARALGLEIDYIGVDLSAKNVALATAAGVDVRQGDVADRLPFEAGSFDCVFCLEVLEHLVSPLVLLQEIRRVLTAEGRAVVSVPSPYSWVELAREVLGRHDTEGHVGCFTTPVMTNIAALAGLRVRRRLGTSLRLPWTARPLPTNSILARSRLYVLAPAEEVVFAGRAFGGREG